MGEKILLEELRNTQNKFGYLKGSELIKLSKEMDMPLARIYGTATFYSFFRTGKKGRHVIRVCNNLPCIANGSVNVIKFLKKELGIGPGETTKDGKFSIELTSCIGCCKKPPAIMLDEMLYTGLSEKKLKSLFEKIK